MNLSKLKGALKGKTLIYGLAGAAVLFLLYRYFSSRGGSSSTDTGVPTPDQSGLTAAEQVGSQEAADVTQLQSDIGALQGSLDALTSQWESALSGAGAGSGDGSTPAVAAGSTKVDRKKPKPKQPKKPAPKKPRPRGDHPKGHQSNRKHAGSGAVAPSGHGNTPGPGPGPVIVGGGIIPQLRWVPGHWSSGDKKTRHWIPGRWA